jgi:dolichol-phosphate mannosyltransferase
MGQSAAFLSGARAAVTELLVFMDADGQNDPQDIAKLLRAFQGNLPAAAAVLGQRVGRRDVWSKRISSKLANRLRRAILHDNTRDTGCSLKLIRRADYLALPYFDHMHRFLPAMLMRNGVELRHVDVSHRPRARGVSKYGFRNRAFVGVVDLFGSAWLIQRGLPLDYSSTEIGKGSPL